MTDSGARPHYELQKVMEVVARNMASEAQELLFLRRGGVDGPRSTAGRPVTGNPLWSTHPITPFDSPAPGRRREREERRVVGPLPTCAMRSDCRIWKRRACDLSPDLSRPLRLASRLSS